MVVGKHCTFLLIVVWWEIPPELLECKLLLPSNVNQVVGISKLHPVKVELLAGDLRAAQQRGRNYGDLSTWQVDAESYAGYGRTAARVARDDHLGRAQSLSLPR